MNPHLDRLHPYPFERLRTLLAGVSPPTVAPISLAIGEPQHAVPDLVRRAMVEHLDGLSVYPATAGLPALREALAAWFTGRHALPPLDPEAQVLPVAGTREALFAIAQAAVDGSRPGAAVVCPNPFYQIYEGAALLAGAEPVFLNQTPANGFDLDFESLAEEVWQRTQLVYVCTPGNPTGRVLPLEGWKALFERADRYGFVIASDECYSEIYPDDEAPPIGGLGAAHRLGRHDYRGLLVFASLSKRSSAPGLRSGAVAGDAALIRQFLRYRTYHGCAMSLVVQQASLAAWNDEAHVRDSRARYREAFAAAVPRLRPVLRVEEPEGGFFLWAGVPGGDAETFTRDLFAATHVTVLPGEYLARDAHGCNPGRGFVRLALVAAPGVCAEAARRIADWRAR